MWTRKRRIISRMDRVQIAKETLSSFSKGMKQSGCGADIVKKNSSWKPKTQKKTKKYDEYTEVEQACVHRGTIGLLYAIQSKNPMYAAQRASRINRRFLTKDPARSRMKVINFHDCTVKDA